MWIKNVSFEELSAVKEDTRTIVPFKPQEVMEVSDADGKWFMERYNGFEKVYFMAVEAPAPVMTEVPQEVAEMDQHLEDIQKEVTPEKFTCMICGTEAASKAGLTSHMRKHA
jgi:hypothetical protein